MLAGSPGAISLLICYIFKNKTSRVIDVDVTRIDNPEYVSTAEGEPGGWCRHDIQLECIVPANGTTLSSHIQEQLRLEAARLKSSTPFIDKVVPAPAASVLDLFGQSCGENEVQLLCPPVCSLNTPGSHTSRMSGN